MAEENSIAGIVGQVLEEIQKRDVRTGGQPGSREENSPPADKVLRVALGCDHGGYEAKELLKIYLGNLGYRVTDVGTHSKESVDYPDFALQVARKVAGGQCERGIMIDGYRFLHSLQQGARHPGRSLLRPENGGQQPGAQQRQCPHPGRPPPHG